MRGLLEELEAATGAGIRVLLLDSGVRRAHEAFAGLRAFEAFRIEGDSVVADSAHRDVFGHGTAVASILHRNAPGAEIHSLQIFDVGGVGLTTRTRNALLGLRWGIERRYDLINCSFVSEQSETLAEFKELVDLAFRRRVLIVAASDNEDPEVPRYPGEFPTVLSTTYGPAESTLLRRRPGCLIEFQAPGERVRVAWSDGGYRIATGSSYAAPHLAALAARVRELRSEWNACQVKAALYELAQGARAGDPRISEDRR